MGNKKRRKLRFLKKFLQPFEFLQSQDGLWVHPESEDGARQPVPGQVMPCSYFLRKGVKCISWLSPTRSIIEATW